VVLNVTPAGRVPLYEYDVGLPEVSGVTVSDVPDEENTPDAYEIESTGALVVPGV
jgi:hypothetical protein